MTLRIAVVEDNEDSRTVLRAVLAPLAEIVEYTNATDAWASILDHPVHLVLTDISMPGRDGIWLIKQMRGDIRTAGIPVVAVTAHAMKGDREMLLELGFDDYVSKPLLDFAQLRDLVSRHLTLEGR